MFFNVMQLCSYAVMQFCGYAIPQAPLLGGRALKNSPVGYFSEGARLQGRFVVEGMGVGYLFCCFAVMGFCSVIILAGLAEPA